MKSRFAVIVFFIFFFAGYVILGYTRHCIYEEEINKNVTKFVGARDEGITKPMAWEEFPYHGAPEAVPVIEDPVYKEVVYSFYDAHLAYSAEYQIEVVPQLVGEVTDAKWNLWDAYTSWAAFEALRIYAYAGGFVRISLGPDVSKDVCGSLAESIVSWEAAGGKREGNWMEVYKQSPEYWAWLDQWFTQISGPGMPLPEIDDETEKMIDELIRKALSEGKSEDDPYVQALYKAKELGEFDKSHEEEQIHGPRSIEERHQDVVEGQELPFWTTFFFGDILEADQKLMEITFNQYVEHLGEKDIVRAGIDSGIIEALGDSFDLMGKNGYGTSYVFNHCAFPLKDLIADACVLILFSVVSTIFMMKWVLPRFTSQAKQEDQKEKPV